MKEQILENPTLVCTEQEQVHGEAGLQGHLEIPREIHGEPGDTGGFKDTRVEGDT